MLTLFLLPNTIFGVSENPETVLTPDIENNVETSAAETETNTSAANNPITVTMPKDEFDRFIWYGFLPEELAAVDPDSFVVSYSQFTDMLYRAMQLLDEEKAENWLKKYSEAASSEAPINYGNAILAVFSAAEGIGGDVYARNCDDSGEHKYSGHWESAACWGNVYRPTIGFERMTHETARGDFFHWACHYVACRASLVSGKTIFEYEDGNTAFPGDRPLTLRKAMYAVLRWYESCFTERVPNEHDIALLAEVEAKKQSILNSTTDVEYTGKAYYVSNDGNDKNDGRSPEKAWKTLAKVNSAKADNTLQYGDAVFFERGGLWRDYLDCAKGVTYSAYGEGEKPKIYGSPENGTGSKNWKLWYNKDGTKIWKYTKPITEVGCIVLNDGEEYGYRVYAFFNGEEWVVSGHDQRPFDIVENLTEDMQFYSTFDLTAEKYRAYQKKFNKEKLYADNVDTTGELYFRCDKGNPGKLYNSIEFSCIPAGWDGCLVKPSGDNVVDNLCIRYCLINGIAIGGEGPLNLNNDNNIIQNCEIGWMGGDQHDINWDTGNIQVCGEAIVIITDNNIIRNNYIYHAAQGTFVSEFGGWECVPGAIQSSNNLIEGNVAENGQYCFWFLQHDSPVKDTIFWDGYTIRDNYILNTGKCWHNDYRVVYPGKRTDADGAWHFDVMTHRNGVRNMKVTNNVFYLSSSGYLIDVRINGDPEGRYDITFSNNTYVQHDPRNILPIRYYRNTFPQYFISSVKPDDVKNAIAEHLGDESAIIFN